MDVDLLRKRLKEIRESIASGTMPEVPGMENAYQPTNPSPVEPYNPPEVAAPISTNAQAPKTTPVSAPKPVVPTASTSNNTAKVDPKTGQNGLKAFTDITSKSPQFGELGIGNADLIDAYNAGLNGVDLSRETRDNAAAGGYLNSIETMFNAGLQDAKPIETTEANTPSVDNSKVNVPNINPATTENTLDKTTGKNSSNDDLVFKPTAPSVSEIRYTPDSDPPKVLTQEMFDLYNLAANSAYIDPTLDTFMRDWNNIGKPLGWAEKAFNTWVDSFNTYVKPKSLKSETAAPPESFVKTSLINAAEKIGLTPELFESTIHGLSTLPILLSGKKATDETIMPVGPYAGWKVTAGFDDKTTSTYFGHTGYDLGGDGKHDIYPILPGKVVAIERNPEKNGNDIVVVVEHKTPDGHIFYSSYSHLSKIEDVDHIIGKEVGTDTLIGQRGGTGLGNNNRYHLHLAVFTAPENPDQGLLTDPAGYSSGDKETPFEKTEGCIYNEYYCITMRKNGRWKEHTYYDAYLVMLTNGGIIDLYPRPNNI